MKDEALILDELCLQKYDHKVFWNRLFQTGHFKLPATRHTTIHFNLFVGGRKVFRF